MSIYAHHLVISGYRQHRGRMAGCDRVYSRLGKYLRPGVRVEMMRWNHDWPSEAQYIERHAPANFRPLVCIYAYSWGFGWGAMRLTQALAELDRPLKVFGLIGCDGVYRHGYRYGNWRALWPWSTIRLPWNVSRRSVRLFCQTGSLPRGHRVVDSLGTVVDRELIEHVHDEIGIAHPATHMNVDEAKPWIDACDTLGASAERIVKRKIPPLGPQRDDASCYFDREKYRVVFPIDLPDEG